ncbi:low molecular weight protein-tyrosine-phosphatase [Daejeonella lutea]|uniref:protein-tyrosine-phosphatase n=1 Tax=Daejeonella lutea TaxID=572036 RepID=A0A1T5DLP1_9SPHI|nr:low molecular weight protein-tyrosine-phosphatase [Daejeonella lutea]SKB72413.1 protein-tyrosine phosphatase [Daejeonella lutea]
MKILMVCLGNICRSPLAHGILEHLAREEGLDWEIDSAGTGNWHIGQQPDRRSIAVAKNYGVNISSQCCRQFDVSDFDMYDHIFVMDYSNLSDVKSLARNESDLSKVSLLLKTDIVPDPYYDDSLFDPVYKMVESRCREIIKELSSGA